MRKFTAIILIYVVSTWAVAEPQAAPPNPSLPFGNRLVSASELRAAPAITRAADGRLLMSVGDILYARGNFKAGQPLFQVVRQGRRLLDPDTGTDLGLEAISLGRVRLIASRGDRATLAIEQSIQEISVGDRLLSVPTITEDLLNQTDGDLPAELEGRILAVATGVNLIGQFDIVTLNKGRRDGLVIGHHLAVRPEASIAGLDAAVGRLEVIKVFDRAAYAWVEQARQPLSVGARVYSPQQDATDAE